jgi:hypothetical protein
MNKNNLRLYELLIKKRGLPYTIKNGTIFNSNNVAIPPWDYKVFFDQHIKEEVDSMIVDLLVQKLEEEINNAELPIPETETNLPA